MSRRKERGGSASALASQNEVLLDREICIEKGDPPRMKIGDGSTPYNDLPYVTNEVVDTKETAANSVSISGTTNNLSIGTADMIVLSNTTDDMQTVTGIAGGTTNAVKRVVNAGSTPIAFAGENGNSTAGNRFKWSALLSPEAMVTLIYRGSRWEIYG